MLLVEVKTGQRRFHQERHFGGTRRGETVTKLKGERDDDKAGRVVGVA